MATSYKKLWKLLIDRDMKKKDLAAAAAISNFTISKMSAGNNVTVEILGKICVALDCKLDDILEFIPDETEKGEKSNG
jgi:DNA-binding Xre family transcriptional regulator